jgi:PAS domain S-box-containing protein
MTVALDKLLPAGGIVDALDVGVLLVGADCRVQVWNRWMAQASGRSVGDIVGRSLWEAFPELRDTRFRGAVEDALETGASSILSYTLHNSLLPLRRPDGRPLLHNMVVRPLAPDDLSACLVQVTDQTAVAERERLLRERRDAQYRAVVDAAHEAIVTTDISGMIQWMNGAAERHFGYASGEAVGHDIGLLLASGEGGRWPRGQAALAWNTESASDEMTARRRDGSLFDVELSIGRWTSEGRVFLTGILRDVTERRRARQALERALTDKTVLLREVNHRVKNSLQLVSGLLNLQVATVESEVARHHLREAAQRIAAVARIHHRLYQTERFETIDFAVFLRELCNDLSGSVSEEVGRIHIDAETLEIPNDQATPLGLIANELITNAIKHRGGGTASVEIALKRGDGHFILVVKDEGPGLPRNFDPRRSRSLGMRIITALTQQLAGRFEILPVPQGAAFSIRVPVVAPAPVAPAPAEPAGEGRGRAS